MAKNRPSILDIAPAVQDKTRVGGLMEDIEVPGGEFADMDIMKEQLIKMGFPPGMINDFFEKAKKNPAQFDKRISEADKLISSDPELLKRMESIFGGQQPTEEEDYPEDFGGDQGAF